MFSIVHLVDMSLAGTHPPGINVLFFDWGADPSERGLYHYGSDLQRGTRELVEDESTIRAGVHFSTVVPVGGREWELLGHPTTAYLSAERSAWSLGVLGGGFLVTVAIAVTWRSSPRTLCSSGPTRAT